MPKDTAKVRYYKKYEIDRDKYVKAILRSNSPKKVIIAGPGTGKSHLFGEICNKNTSCGETKNLTLTFINELVIDLAKDLHKISEVKTLHGFARGIIKGHKKYYLRLENIISQDYRIMFGKKIDFDNILCNLKNNKKATNFYFKRRGYYDYYSPNSSVYMLVKYFQEDKGRIPKYTQILIDEYQDFNKLECELINLLTEKNPVVIVGDDDQSLYGWKHANPDEIRSINISPDYESFDLPYCSRSTKVIIDAFKCTIKEAKKRGLLQKRQSRYLKYFPSEKRDRISDKFSTIFVKRNVYVDSIAFHIDTQIRHVINPKKSNEVSVLIISPFKKQVKVIEKALIKKGYRNIRIRTSKQTDSILEGFNLLLQDSTCNLGWRIVSEAILKKSEFNEILKESHKREKQKKSFSSLLDIEHRKYIKSILATLRKVKNAKSVDEEKVKEAFDCLNYDPFKISKKRLQQSLEASNISKNTHKDILIQITTIQGSKGLEGDLVFLANFDKRFVYENSGSDITDECVCKFLVALTRARAKLFIYSSDENLPAFIEWLEEEMYDEG